MSIQPSRDALSRLGDLQHLQLNLDGRVLTARLHNPPHNFLTTAMVRELERLVVAVEEDRRIGAVVLTGADNGAFISHFDITEIFEGGDQVQVQLSPRSASVLLRLIGALRHLPGCSALIERGPLAGVLGLIRLHELFDRIEASEVTYIAAINGRALGGGCELALACDFRLMADGDQRIGFPELNNGIIPGAGGTQRLARCVGASRAAALVLDAQLLGPNQAEHLGVVHQVVDAQRLLPMAQALGQRLARRSRLSVGAAKRSIYAAGGRDGFHRERVGFLCAASTPAANRALRLYARRLDDLTDNPLALEAEMEAWRQGQVLDLNADPAERAA